MLIVLCSVCYLCDACKGGGYLGGKLGKDGRGIDCSMKGSYCACHECACDYGQIHCGGGGQYG